MRVGGELLESRTIMAADLEMVVIDGQFPTPNSVVQYLKLLTTEDPPLVHFKAEMDKHPLDITAGPEIFYDRTPLHLAALHGKLDIAKLIMASPNISAQVVNAKDHFGYTPLHLAVRSNHVDVVRLLTSSSLTSRSSASTEGFTPLHLAATVGNIATVKLLLDYQDKRVLLRATNWDGMTALDIAKQTRAEKLVELLECCDVEWLELERQKSANSVNAILVGAVLVATVTFSCLLQPPLGVLSQNQSASSGSPASVAYSQTADDHTPKKGPDLVVGWFLLMTVFSFVCSVVSLVIGTAATIPSTGASLKKEVEQLRKYVLLASRFLFWAIFCLVFAYQGGNNLVLAAVAEQPDNTILHVGEIVILSAVPMTTVPVLIATRKARWRWVEHAIVSVCLVIGFFFTALYILSCYY